MDRKQTSDSLIGTLADWVDQNAPTLKERGVCVELQLGPNDIPVPWATVLLETDRNLAHLLLMQTGLADLEAVDVATSASLLNEHRELRSESDLHRALQTLVDRVADGRAVVDSRA
jgi:hypothetical protein